MKTEAGARDLAENLMAIAEANGVRTEAVLTAMDTPLGRAVGNAIEVIEAIETLKGRGPDDVEALSVKLAARMLVVGGVHADGDAAERAVHQALASGAGLERLRAIIEAQGGDPLVVDDYGRFPTATAQAVLPAPRSGFVTSMDAEHVGRAAVVLGAGRDRLDADVDPAAGIEILARVGDPVREGEAMATVSGRDGGRVAAALGVLAGAVTVGDEAPASAPLIIDVLRPVTGSAQTR
jgi:thymidine phosphorylase